MIFNKALIASDLKPMTYNTTKQKTGDLIANVNEIEADGDWSFEMARDNNAFHRNDFFPYKDHRNACILYSEKADNKNVYHSAYVYGAPQYTDDCLIAGNMYYDIDVEGSTSDEETYRIVAEQAKAVVDWVNNRLCIPKEIVDISFSGSKGFHVVVPTSHMGLGWRKDLNIIFKEIATLTHHECAPDLDLRIYDRRRLLRMDNTINGKSGLYKVPVSYDMLTRFSLSDMRRWASEPRRDTFSQNPFYIEDAERALVEILKGLERKVGITNIAIPLARRDTMVGGLGAQADARNNNDNIAAIKSLNNKYFNRVFDHQKQSMTEKEAATYMKSNVNLGAYLGIPESCNCIFHDDKTPSAVIMPPREDRTDWIYYCHSSKCAYKKPMNIIDVTMAIAGVEFIEAVKFLSDCFNIVLQGKTSRHINDLTESNKTAIKTLMGENTVYKKKLQPIMDTYTAVLEIAKTTAKLTNTQYYGSDVYFSASKRFIAKQIGTKDEGTTHRKTVLLAALGLVEKIADADLPESCKQRNYVYHRDLETFYGSDRTIQYYRVTAIDSLKGMQGVKKQLEKWIAGKGQIDKINEYLISRIFGYDVAACIYAKKEQANIAGNALRNSEEIGLIA